jgi:hypothetical protein
MSDILSRAVKLGLEFREEEEETLRDLGAHQELLHVAEDERARLAEMGEDTTLQERVIAKIRKAIDQLSRKLR